MGQPIAADDLKRAEQELKSLEMKHPEAFADFVGLFKRNRRIGYKNLSKMLLGEQRSSDTTEDED